MSERKPSAVLDPYCPQCGAYKGVGECRTQTCKSVKWNKENDDSHRIGECTRCDNSVAITCSRCGNGYCTLHSENSLSSRIEKFIQSMGTCSICGLIVCENCWLVGDNGEIQCLKHWEETK